MAPAWDGWDSERVRVERERVASWTQASRVTPDLYSVHLYSVYSGHGVYTCTVWGWLPWLMVAASWLWERLSRSQSEAASSSRPQPEAREAELVPGTGKQCWQRSHWGHIWALSSILSLTVTAVSSDFSEAGSYPSYPWSRWHTPASGWGRGGECREGGDGWGPGLLRPQVQVQVCWYPEAELSGGWPRQGLASSIDHDLVRPEPSLSWSHSVRGKEGGAGAWVGWANTPHLEHLNITTTITLTLGTQRTEHHVI